MENRHPTIVRCGGKSEIDRFYRLYSEFGIPCYIIFDRDYQNVGKDDEKATISKNHGILGMFGVEQDFPDDTVTDKYLGFKYRLEENLNIGQVGGTKALRLYQRTKEAIKTAEQVPAWVGEVIEKIKSLPMEAESILLEEDNEFDFRVSTDSSFILTDFSNILIDKNYIHPV